MARGSRVAVRHLSNGYRIQVLRRVSVLRHLETAELRHEATVGVFLAPVGSKVCVALGLVVVGRGDAPVFVQGGDVGAGAEIGGQFGVDTLFHILEIAWLICGCRLAGNGHGHRGREGQLNVFAAFHLRLPADQLDGVMHAALSMPTLIATAAT